MCSRFDHLKIFEIERRMLLGLGLGLGQSQSRRPLRTLTSTSLSIYPPSLFSMLTSIKGLCNDGFSKKLFSTSSCFLQATKNHYEVLNVNRTATTGEIREAFLKLSKEYHPDLNIGDPEEDHKKFVAINEAYTVLSKPTTRRDYDLTLQVKKHFRQQSNYPAYRSYGFQADAPHYHHRSRTHVDWDGMSSSSHAGDDSFRNGKNMSHGILMNFSLTVVFTIGFIALLLGSRDYIMPSLPRNRVLRKKTEMNEKDFIMSSIHEGQTVVYYAVPDENNPEVSKVHAFVKKEIEGNPDEYILEELTSV